MGTRGEGMVEMMAWDEGDAYEMGLRAAEMVGDETRWHGYYDKSCD